MELALDIEVVNEYPAPAETVVAMFADPAFVTARAAALDHRRLEILACGPANGGYEIHYVRDVPVTVPGFAARVLSPRTTIEQHDRWEEARPDGGRLGSWRITARGVPVEMAGEIELTPQGGGSRHHITGTLQVAVPIVGGKLAAVLAADTRRTIDAEHRFGLGWLAAHP